MLKITSSQAGSVQVLRLEGKLLAEWLDELREACRIARETSLRLQLDLSGLSFADATGEQALRELMREGATITTASPFLGELLKE